MGKPHVLVIPFPAQGHVIPLMELSKCLADHGFKVTFVNTEYIHKRVLDAMADASDIGDEIHLVSIPDGMQAWEDRNDLGKLFQAIIQVMPRKLEELIKRINEIEGDKITCVIADGTQGWALEVAEKMKIRRAAFCPAAAAIMGLVFGIPKLIQDGIIHSKGAPLKNQMIQLAPNMPIMRTENLVWACFGDVTTQRIIFETMVRNNKELKVADWVLCNSAYDLEPAAFTLAPEILPIGPLLATNRLGNSSGSFWEEDPTCLNWLDQQPPCSVIYVAFGSFTVFEQTQFHELALGLELTKRPFLWVVRPDVCDKTKMAYLEVFTERIGSLGKIVGWAPQQRILSHPSVACFLSHCGWNSTMEGVSNGVPFLCWPYFADQFLNESYICDVWKVGLKFAKQKESGIITGKEIKNKVDQLLGDKKYMARALELKDMAMNNAMKGGKSNKILENFIQWVKS